MTGIRDIQIQASRSAMRGSGKGYGSTSCARELLYGAASKTREVGKLFTKHLTEYVLQSGLFVGRKSGYFLFQPTFIDRPYLVGDNLTVAFTYMAWHPKGITVNGRCDGYDDYRGKVLVQLLWTHHYAGTHFLHLCTDSRVEVNPIDIKLIYHCQSSTLSSSKMSAATSWSSPCLCALRAAADHPFLTAGVVTGTSVKTTLRMSRSAMRAFCMAISLSKIGLSSRSSSARSCIAVIILNIYWFHGAKVLNKIETQLETK